jgi:hypothetical protein
LALNAKGGENNRPKAKGPNHHPYFLKPSLKKGERLFKKKEINRHLQKNLLTAKGRIYSGELLFSQRESI